MTTPLAEIDRKLDDLLQAANKLRQLRDSLPVGFWNVIPLQFRAPFEVMFLAVEEWDRFIGRMRDVGLMPPKDLTPTP